MRGMRNLSPMWGIAGLLFSLLLLALIVTVVVLAVRLYRTNRWPGVPPTHRNVAGYGPGPGAPGGPLIRPDALAILDERLARGDIDVGDYEARRRALLGEPPGPDAAASDPLA